MGKGKLGYGRSSKSRVVNVVPVVVVVVVRTVFLLSGVFNSGLY